jgi:hypothetical protein
MLFYMCVLSPFRHEPFLRLGFLRQCVVPDSSSVPASTKCFVLYLPLKLCNVSEHLIIIFLYVMDYASLFQ